MDELDQLLKRYSALIQRYHKTLDLLSDAGVRDLPRHILDAREYARLIANKAGDAPTIVDVGSGAGLPAVVIAAALPGATVHLVERRRRRTAFLELVCSTLGLSNTQVHGSDVLELDNVCADVVTAQAVADIPTLVRLTRHLHADPCWLVSRRGESETSDVTGVWRAAGLLADDAPAPADYVPAGAELLEEPLEARGSLVAVKLPGGSACQPSA